jgi:hypothetical protein
VPRPAGPRTLVGIVTDTLGAPLEDVTVFVHELRRQTRTRAGGEFRFDSVPAGRYSVGARRIGYIVAAKTVTVGPNGGAVELRMIHLGTYLAPMVTEASRGGLSGIVGDTAFRALADVQVRVIGASAVAHTDSSGAFYLPIKPGHYLVLLELRGFVRQRVGVTIPDTGGRQIAAWLIPQNGRANPIEGVNLFELERRMNLANPVYSRFLTREDLLKSGAADAARAASQFAAARVKDSECALINGGPDKVPLWTIAVSDIEFMETNVTRPPRRTATSRGVTSIGGNKKLETGISDAQLSCAHVVWMRK